MKGKKGAVPMTLGLALILAALALSCFNIWTDQRARTASDSAMNQLADLRPEAEPAEAVELTVPTAALPDYKLFPEMEMPVKSVNGQDYIGTLSIPSLELELPIISWWSGDRFQIAPCRYVGSAYQGDLVLAAHNYPSHFGKIRNLLPGDGLTFTDMDGNVFSYEVARQEILQGTDVEEMESGNWDLTLFTCTIGGKYRVTVRCDQVENRL